MIYRALATGCLFCCRGGLYEEFAVANLQFVIESGGAANPKLHIANCKLQIMIVLTRLNGQSFVVNAEKIRYVESTPDTIVCCDTGEKLMVKEPLPEVMRRAIEYARTIRKPITD